MHNSIILLLKFVCGTEGLRRKRINRANLFTLISLLSTVILLLFTYSQLRDVKETNSADFALKLRTDIFSADNATLLYLLDDSLLRFCSSGNNDGWFALDTALIKKRRLPHGLIKKDIPRYYTLVQVDLLLMNFENLSFYERRGQIKMDYIYQQFAYYIRSTWNNVDIKKYIKMTRCQPSLSRAYGNFQRLENCVEERFKVDSIAFERQKASAVDQPCAATNGLFF